MAKRPMRVVIEDKMVKVARSSYNCPNCKTHCVCNIETMIVRFNCIQCGRELIIDRREKVT